jgi:hypothetical protein
MNDHDTLASRPDDIADAGQSPSASIGNPANPARASDPKPIRAIPDATTRLVADVLGMTAERTAEVLKNLGGLKGLAHAAEAELLSASVPRSRARLVRAAFELGRLSIGERPRLGQHLTSLLSLTLIHRGFLDRNRGEVAVVSRDTGGAIG